MCDFCIPLSRRAFSAGALFLPLGLGAKRRGLLEPVLRLAPATPPGQVAVTLDACPGRFDPRIANMLVAQKIPATIFITAIWMRQNPRGLAFLLACVFGSFVASPSLSTRGLSFEAIASRSLICSARRPPESGNGNHEVGAGCAELSRPA